MISSGPWAYGDGLFQSDATVSFEDQLTALLDASFTGIVLWALHFQENGDLYYNDTLAVSGGELQPLLNGAIPDWLAELRSAGLQQVGISIGPFVSDFAAINANPHLTLLNLRTFFDWVGADFVDIDYETPSGQFGPDDTTLVTAVTGLVSGGGFPITYCPYDETGFWIDCLALVLQQLGRQPVIGLNLQTYGTGADPAAWVTALAVAADRIGITDAAAYVNAGYKAMAGNEHGGSSGDCPSAIQTAVALAHAKAGIGAAWIWNTSLVLENQYEPPPLFCDPSDDRTMLGYANALRSGLG